MHVRFDSKRVLLRTGEYECENGRYEYRYSVFGKRYSNYLNDERKLKLGTIDGVHNILHQVLQVAVDDELILQNPADNAIKELMRSHNMHRKKCFNKK